MNSAIRADKPPEAGIPSNTFLFEIAWEVCNQVGGIYTVIRSKVPSVIEQWGSENYFLIGPYFEEQAAAHFEPATDYTSNIGKAVLKMQERGFNVHYGQWIVSGRPQVILFDPFSVYDKLPEIKHYLFQDYHISLPGKDELIDKVVAFGFQVKEFLSYICTSGFCNKSVIAHFHEWMAGVPIPGLRKENLDIKIVFTTHATLLGRYLAMNDTRFYEHLAFYNWEKEAIRFNVKPIVDIERASAHGAHVFTTVSELTGRECTHLLGRSPDMILPNGLNIQRFEALHHVQNQHLQFKEKIHDFVMGHFFQSYSFDLDNTIYFFTSGRYEYHNKGYDLTLEALARLNWRMQQAKSNKTVVAFLLPKSHFIHLIPKCCIQKRLLKTSAGYAKRLKSRLGKGCIRLLHPKTGVMNSPI